MAYELVWEPEGVLMSFSGVVKAREFIQAVEQTQGDSRFDEAHYVIIDFLAVTGHDLADNTLTQLAAMNFGAHASNPNCRMVFVTTDVALVACIKNILTGSGMTSYEVEVRPTVAEARDWLDAQPKLQLMSNVMGFRAWQ